MDRDRQSIISDLGPSPLENWNAIDPKFTKITSHHGSRAPSKAASRVASQRNQSRDLNDLAESELDYVDVGKEIRMSQGGKPGLDDAASDEQDGLRSEFNGEVRDKASRALPIPTSDDTRLTRHTTSRGQRTSQDLATSRTALRLAILVRPLTVFSGHLSNKLNLA